MTISLDEGTKDITPINTFTLGDTTYPLHRDLQQSDIGFFTLAVHDILDAQLEIQETGYDAENILPFPPRTIKRESQIIDTDGVVLLSPQLSGSRITPEKGRNLREGIMNPAGKHLLMLLLNRISEVKPIQGSDVYYSLSRHLDAFGKTSQHIDVDEYDLLYFTLSRLRLLDSRDIFYQEGDDTVNKVKKIKFDNNWNSETYLIRDFCDAFEYILQTNQANHITSSKQRIA